MRYGSYSVLNPGNEILIPTKIISVTITDDNRTIYKLLFKDIFDNEHEIYISSKRLASDCNPKTLLASYFSNEELIDEVNSRFHMDIPYPVDYDNPESLERKDNV